MRGDFSRTGSVSSTGIVADEPFEGPQKPDFFLSFTKSRLQARSNC